MYEKLKMHGWTAFFLRVVHSFSGVAFTLFLCEHLCTNFLGNSSIAGGKYFVSAVEYFHSIPGLKFIELFCLGLPFGLHALIGVWYILSGRNNVWSWKKNSPRCCYGKNWAYFFQRLTAWILLIGILGHVVQMRFLLYPEKVFWNGKKYYEVSSCWNNVKRVVGDTSDYLVLSKSGIMDDREVTKLLKDSSLVDALLVEPEVESLLLEQDVVVRPSVRDFLAEMGDTPVTILTPSAGKAFLYVVRGAFTSLWGTIAYVILVLAAVFHGFNGLWTFCCRWGIVMSTQRLLYLRRVLFFIVMPLFAGMGTYTLISLYLAK